MSREIPAWAIELVAALEEHEDTHAADNDPHSCVKGILDQVPADVRSYVAAWKDGYRAAKSERAQGGPVSSPQPMIFERDQDEIIVMEQR